MYVTRKGKLQNKDRTDSSGLISLLPQSMRHYGAIKVRPFSADYLFSTSSGTIPVYRERATNMLETMQSNREPALGWKQ